MNFKCFKLLCEVYVLVICGMMFTSGYIRVIFYRKYANNPLFHGIGIRVLKSEIRQFHGLPTV